MSTTENGIGMVPEIRAQVRGPTWLDAGVRIVHNRQDYLRGMTFSCRGGSDEVFALLAHAGFVPRGSGPAGRSMLLTAARFLLAAIAVHAIGWILPGVALTASTALRGRP